VTPPLPSPLLPPLDERLRVAAGLIRAGLHADIGSDHAALPLFLLRNERAERAVIVEKTSGPLEVAHRAVTRSGLEARVQLRLGDGLAPLHLHELESVSLTGMGAQTMLAILERGRNLGRVPEALVLQPNDVPGLLRAWGRVHGYHLTAEALAAGFRRYPVLRLELAEGPDPAYAGMPEAAALQYGPHLLRQAHPLLLEEVQAQLARLGGLERHGKPEVLRDLRTVRSALAWLEQQRVQGQ
jgi:tRNA (adenine22-N1)-methyltransferase